MDYKALYNAPRQPGDIDLIAEVRLAMINAGISSEKIIDFEQNKNIISGIDKTPEVQRYHLNQYWNLQLLSAQKTSIEERYYLIPDGEISDWLRLFVNNVLPFIVRNDLPVRI